MSNFFTTRISDPEFECDGLRCITVKSNALRRRADISLYVPAQLPVDSPLDMVILLHGVYGSHWAWSMTGGVHKTARRLIEQGKMRPMVLVMPSDGLFGDGSGYLKHQTEDYEKWIVADVIAKVKIIPNMVNLANAENRVNQAQITFDNAKAEAGASFKNDGLYLEKFVEEPRHIEIQIAGDRYGTVCHLSERDCSIQRRHQKLVEESPSPFMTDDLRERMGAAAVKAAAAINYESVGTIEFLVDKHRNFYFMEMNTRIQVEHCVTEEVTNFDLIKEQIKIASGDPISGINYYPTMHAIECRINAEDPYLDFRPSPGRITVLHQPGGHGIRVDSHVYAGYTIPPYYDSMIAKIIAVARTRDEAINTMSRALSEYVIEGVKTTIPFHQQLMKHEDFRSGNFTTKFMDSFKMM